MAKKVPPKKVTKKAAPKAAAPRTVNKEAKRGRFVSDEEVRKHPDTTIKETVKATKRKKPTKKKS